jgi:hexosaminidase
VDGLVEAGNQAVRYLSSGTSAPAGWQERQDALIATARQPSAIVRWTFLDALAQLVKAVPQSKS